MRNRIVTLAMVMVVAAAPGATVSQSSAPADVAAKMTGTWKLNKELSPTLANPGRGRGGRRGGGPSFAMISAAPQRGGRGGGGGGEGGGERPFVTDEEAAAQTALMAIQQVPQELAIEATAAEMKLTEARGPSVFKIDGKNVQVKVPGSTIKVKSRWDRDALRQEFSSAMRQLTRWWSVDANGRLVLKQRWEGVLIKRTDVEAVFDRQ